MHSSAVQSALYFYIPENYKESLLACKGQFWHLSGSVVRVETCYVLVFCCKAYWGVDLQNR